MAIIRMKNISKSFFGVKALDNIDFTIEAGEIHCLLGENGCGKSTLIKIISGFYRYDEGELFINEKLYQKITPAESMHEGIQVIYQDFSLFSNMTIAENIMMYERANKKENIIHWRKLRKRAQEALELIGVDMDVDILVEHLSVAQKQIVAICRAISQDVRLIIMDEPTTALTYKEINALYRIVENLNSNGISILFVSHKLDEVMAISQKITVMRNGKNVFHGDTRSVDKEQLVYHMTGRRITNTNYLYKPACMTPILEVRDLGLKDGFTDINFSVCEGEILGITGLLGSGRTELAESLFGIKPYTQGEVKIYGESARISSIQDAIRLRIGYIPEDRLAEGLHLDQSIGDNAIVCVTRKLTNRIKLFNRAKVKACRDDAFGRIQIAGLANNKLARTLSGGNQQKLVLIKWLISNPRIFILNCPTVGVDVGSKHEIHHVIKELANKGISFIVITDDIPELLQLCNRFLVMHNGRIVDMVETGDITLSDVEKKIIRAV